MQNNMQPLKASVIITTYNWPGALQCILIALNEQSFKNFEIIIADDGSNKETEQFITAMQAKMTVPLRHVWQEDQGFRAASIRNKAILVAASDYIIFLDGDCIPPLDFVKNHLTLAENGFFVAGNRILLSQGFSEKILSHPIPIHRWTMKNWIKPRLFGDCNKILLMIHFPLWHCRKLFARRWQGVKTCNLGVFKKNLMDVNGFEEKFTGWGYEDSDLIIRLINKGIFRKTGRFMSHVFHLWHKDNDRSREDINFAMLQARMKSGDIHAIEGLKQKSFGYSFG